MRHKYTETDLREAIASSISIASALSKLGIVPAGGNYATMKKRIKELNIDISHFKGQGHNKDKIIGPKRPIEDYLSNKAYIVSYKLKKRLIREGYFTAKCYSCQRETWQNLPIPLELHHKDGNHDNNNLDNLDLICPNCHAQTNNYRGKNIKK